MAKKKAAKKKAAKKKAAKTAKKPKYNYANMAREAAGRKARMQQARLAKKANGSS